VRYDEKPSALARTFASPRRSLTQRSLFLHPTTRPAPGEEWPPGPVPFCRSFLPFLLAKPPKSAARWLTRSPLGPGPCWPAVLGGVSVTGPCFVLRRLQTKPPDLKPDQRHTTSMARDYARLLFYPVLPGPTHPGCGCTLNQGLPQNVTLRAGAKKKKKKKKIPDALRLAPSCGGG